MKTIALLFCLLCCWSVLSAQPVCYEKIRDDGQRLARQKKYGEAINQFWTALTTCPDLPKNHDLDQLIQKAQAAWVGELETAVRQATDAATAERAAKERAVIAELNARQSQQLAEEKGREAREQARRAESLRLSLLADDLRQKGRKSDALLVAFLSCRLAGDSLRSLPALRRAFGEAVRDSMSEVVFTGDAPLRSVRWLPGSGQKIVAQLADGSAHFFDLEKKKGHLLAPPSSPAAGLAISVKGDRILTWQPGGPTQLWDNEGRAVAVLVGHSEDVRTAAFSPDGKTVATGSRDNDARFWSAGNGALLTVLSGHTGNIYGVLFSPGSDWLLTRSSDGTVKTWDLSGKNTATFGVGSGYVNGCAIDTFGKIALATAVGGLQICETGGKEVFGKNSFPSNSIEASSVAFFWNNLLVGNSGENNGTSLYNASGKLLATIDADYLVPNSGGLRLAGWNWGSPFVGVWGEGGHLRSQFPLPLKAPNSLTWSPGGSQILLTMNDGTTYLMGMAGDILTEWPADGTGLAMPGLFSPDGESILTADRGGKSLQRTPEPDHIFNRMHRTVNLDLVDVKRIVAEYQIQVLPTNE